MSAKPVTHLHAFNAPTPEVAEGIARWLAGKIDEKVNPEKTQGNEKDS